MRVGAVDLVDQVHPADHVAPLVVAPRLQGAPVAAEELQEVVGLEDLVGELRVGDALVGGDAPRDDVLVQHGAHAEVLANGAQQVDRTHLLRPVEVVHHPRGGRPLEVEEPRDLVAQFLRPPLDDLGGLELALAALTGIADLAGRPAHEREGLVARQLQVAHDDQLHQVPVVQ